jgi:hypothetical protein
MHEFLRFLFESSHCRNGEFVEGQNVHDYVKFASLSLACLQGGLAR